MSRFGLRTRLTILVAVAAAITLAVLTAGFNLLLRSNLDADANRVLQARASAALEAITVRRGALRVSESPDKATPDSQVWIYEGKRAIERPPAAPTVQRLADSLAQGSRTGAEDSATDTRLRADAVGPAGAPAGTVVSALSLEPYEHSASRALFASLVYAGAALLLVVIVTRLVVNRALRPVAQMTAEAADWSEHDLEHRFNVGEPYDELTQLAATFDDMLARLASSLRHEQTLSAELSHELRTPLAAIVAEVELALRRDRGSDEYREALREIGARASHLQRTLETLMASARAESLEDLGTASADAVARQAIAACQGVARDAGVELSISSPGHSPNVDVDIDTAERILVPLIENGCRYGRRRVGVRVGSNGGSVEFWVEDDGPGIRQEELEAVFEPGFRGSAASADEQRGAGLGLPLARRLARAVGGDVDAYGNGSGGCFRVRIPSAHG